MMSVVLRYESGAQAAGYDEMAARTRLDDEQVRRQLALEMFVKRQRGMTPRQVARQYRVSERHVRRCIAWLPEDVKERALALR